MHCFTFDGHCQLCRISHLVNFFAQYLQNLQRGSCVPSKKRKKCFSRDKIEIAILNDLCGQAVGLAGNRCWQS